NPDLKRPVIQTGSFATALGEIILELDSDTLEVLSAGARLVDITTTPQDELVSNFPRVAEVKDIVDAALEYADEKNPVVGHVTQNISTAYSGATVEDGVYQGGAAGDRTQESAAARLVANIYRDSQAGEAKPPQFGAVIPNFVRSDLAPSD